MDVAGVADAIRPDTDTPLRQGDAVITIVRPYEPRGGAYTELVVVPAESVVPIPSDVDLPAASTLLMNVLTARLGLGPARRADRWRRQGGTAR
jgi:NADPH:quinone reductase